MLSLHTISRQPTGMRVQALNGIGGGLGDYREGTCSQGADFFCESRNGVFSCMPCDYPQLQTFKDLQVAVNAILESRGLAARIERGPKARSAIDGRIGPSTTAAIGALASVIAGEVPPSGAAAGAIRAAMTMPNDPATMRAVAANAAEIYDWLGQVGAKIDEPLPAPSPGSQVASKSSRNRAIAAVAIGVAVLAAVGLIGTAVSQKRS